MSHLHLFTTSRRHVTIIDSSRGSNAICVEEGVDGEERVFYVQVLSEATEVAEVGSPEEASWCAELTETPKKCQGNAKETPKRLV
jgi:hypothetical protein